MSIEKYRKMNAPVKMAFWFLICNFLQKGIGMITTPLFTRLMTDSEFGRYNIFNSWHSIISVFVSLSISGNCFMRAIVIIDNEQEEQKLASSFYGLIISLVCFYALLYYLFRNWINTITGLSSYQFLMMGIDILAIQAGNLWINSKRVKYEYRGIIFLTLSMIIIRPLISIIFVIHAPVTEQVEARITGIAVANIILFSWTIIILFSKGRVFYDPEKWKYALSFCIPLVPHYLSQTILNQSDRIMISHYIGNAEAGYYSVAYILAAIVLTFNIAVAQTLDPWIYRSIKTHNLSRIGPVSYRLMAIIALMNFIIMALAPEVLSVMAPSNYQSALWVIPPVTTSVFFQFMYDLFASFQFYYKKTKWIALGSCGGALLNILLNALFIPSFGFVAAGYTTMVCYIMFGFLHYWFMRKVCNENLGGYKVYDWKIIFGIGLALILLSLIMTGLYYQAMLIRYIIIFCIICIGIIKRKEISQLVKSLKKEDV